MAFEGTGIGLAPVQENCRAARRHNLGGVGRRQWRNLLPHTTRDGGNWSMTSQEQWDRLLDDYRAAVERFSGIG